MSTRSPGNVRQAFVTILLVIGRWRDVTEWVFYQQTQANYFRKFFGEKSFEGEKL